METSDSEYFESADEEFYSDDDADSKSKEEEVFSEIQKLSIADKSLTSKTLTSEKTKELGTAIDSKKKVIAQDVKSVEKDKATKEKCDILTTELTTEEKMLENENCNSDSLQSKLPPGASSCWEPGMNYDEGPIVEKPIKSSENIQQTEIFKFGVRPSRVVCWVPGANDNKKLSASKNDGNKRELNIETEVNTLPPREERCEESISKNEPTLKKPIKENKRPEFGIPPAIVHCWEEGVNDVLKPIQPEFVVSPDVVHVSKEGVTDVPKRPPARVTCYFPKRSIMQESEKSQNKENSEEAKCIPLSNAECSVSDANKHKESTNLHSTASQSNKNEEDMWENDDWKTVEVSTLAHKTPDALEIKSDKQSLSEKKTTDENMWDGDEDWNNFGNDKTVQQKEDMWEDDDWEPIEDTPPTDETEKVVQKVESGWGSWGTWGLSSVLSTATTLTNQVSQSFTTVLESGIGAPNPEELAKRDKSVEKELEELPQEKPTLGFGLGNLVQGVTKLVETTGTKVISGGLDTLETIGKKTMEVLQENDPGLRKKRALLKLDDDKPSLSHILREAKEKAEQENKELERQHFSKKPNYETLFDDHQGLVHLEALEMLSKQCDIKLSSLLESYNGEALVDMQETMDQVKELSELPDEEEDEHLSTEEIKEKLEAAVSELNIKITYNRLLSTWSDVEDWLKKINLKLVNSREIHQQAIETLAQLTAIAVEQFHKSAELLLVKEHRSTADEADSLVQLTVTLTSLIGIVSANFSEKLNMVIESGTSKEEVNDLITNVFFEAANSSTYIQDAFQLLIPVLQVGAL